MTATHKITLGLRTFVSDVVRGFFQITHNGFALLGLVVVFTGLALAAQQDIRQAGEVQLFAWLQDRQASIQGYVVKASTTSALDHVTAFNPDDLPKQQAAVAYWLSKKYNVAPEPISALVAAAYESGKTAKLDPMLVLAVMAVESGFNPFAQSPVGAQGLMQVMTQIHSDKYEDFGGTRAAFDPVSNVWVGVRVLKECVHKAGSIEGGLKYYVGAANLESDGGYTQKVMTEYNKLRQIAAGHAVPTYNTTVKIPTPTPVETLVGVENS